MTQRNLILIAAGGSAALLLGAFVFQYLGYAPCKLCLWQRWPHAAAIALGFLAIVVTAGWLPWAGAVCAATTAGLGIYHTGVERRWWQGPDTCTSGGGLDMSTDDLLNQILAAPLIRCDDVAWALGGLSMASWNTLISLVLCGFWIAAARHANANS